MLKDLKDMDKERSYLRAQRGEASIIH